MIHFFYGLEQRFRWRFPDINIVGNFDGALPVRTASYSLNHGRDRPFYVMPNSDLHNRKELKIKLETIPSRGRLEYAGDFNIEIPVQSPELRRGANRLHVRIEAGDGEGFEQELRFDWNPEPVGFPIDLRDLSGIHDIQSIAQVVNGVFALDRDLNGIRPIGPTRDDLLCLIGSPAGNQEATFEIVFSNDSTPGYFRGCSDFTAAHEPVEGVEGIKGGWSTIGLLTHGPDHELKLWQSWGDLTGSENMWVRQTEPPFEYPLDPHQPYRIRHRVEVSGRGAVTRAKIWPSDGSEPEDWMVSQDNFDVDGSKPGYRRGSFGLFQNLMGPALWRDLYVRELP